MRLTQLTVSIAAGAALAGAAFTAARGAARPTPPGAVRALKGEKADKPMTTSDATAAETALPKLTLEKAKLAALLPLLALHGVETTDGAPPLPLRQQTPPSQPANDLPQLAFEKYTMPNGLEVILHEDHKIPEVAVDVWYKVGSKDESPGHTGFSHLF